MRVIDHRIRTYIETLDNRKKHLEKILSEWNSEKSSLWVLKEVDALQFVIFLLQDLYEDPQPDSDIVGYEWIISKHDPVVDNA